ncbi:MAG: poly-beta-1,6-N-acetyl-D-glucosamine synthase [Cellulosilyticaceae bacterium]
MEIIQNYVFWYPFIMTLIWIAGTIVFFKTTEKDTSQIPNVSWPKVSVLVPCFNEEETIEETVHYLNNLSYPDFEVIVVNDGSTDHTSLILEKIVNQYERLRVIDCKENRGKANALHMATLAAQSEFLICIDSDALLDQDAPYHLMKHFWVNGERVGAVTGNPRIRNRDTLLGKIQLVEYASVIGAIKRTQRVLGKVMTVSGVVVAFRKKALVDVGLWDRDMITEDVAVSWKLQRRFWDIRYEPQALCWMLVPENIKGLWKQRIRWAQGGQEVIFRHSGIFTDWRQRRLWPIYIEQICSLMWVLLWMVTLVHLFIKADTMVELVVWISFSSIALTLLSLVQFMMALKTDSAHDSILKHYLWVVWYPVFYWMLNAFTAAFALPRSIKTRCSKRCYAVWTSPDRGKRDDC